MSTARDMHDVSTAAPIVRLSRTSYPFGGRSKRAPIRTHRVAGAVGKLFGGIISYSAHIVLTLSARSYPQRQPWRGWGALQTPCPRPAAQKRTVRALCSR